MGKLTEKYTTNTFGYDVGSERYILSQSVSVLNSDSIDTSFAMCAPIDTLKNYVFPCYNVPDGEKENLWNYSDGTFNITIPNIDNNIHFAICYYNGNQSEIGENGDNTVYQINRQIYNNANTADFSDIHVVNPTDLRKILLKPLIYYYDAGSNTLKTCDLKYLIDNAETIYPQKVGFESYVWNGISYVSDTNMRYLIPCALTDNFIIPITNFYSSYVTIGQTNNNTQKEFTQAFYGVYVDDIPVKLGDNYNDISINTNVLNETTYGTVDNLMFWYYKTNYNTSLNVVRNGVELLKMLAYLGCYLIADNYNLNNTLDTCYNDDNIWLGEMLEGCYTTGKLIQGKDVLNSDTINKGDFNIDTDYNPDAPKPINNADSEIDMDFGNVYSMGGLVNYYKITSENLKTLSKLLSAVDVVGNKDLLPNLISLKAFAMDFDKMARGTTETIKIGGIEMTDQFVGTATGTKIDATYRYIHCFDYTVKGKFGSLSNPHFLDFYPYTTAELILPLGGTIVLPDNAMYKPLTCDYVFDIVAGTAIAIVKSNGTVITTIPCTFSQDIPFNAINVGAKTSAMVSNISAITHSLANLGISVGTGNVVSGISSAVSIGTSVLNTITANNQNYIEKFGRNGDFCDFGLPKSTYIKYTRPIDVSPNNFGKTHGYLLNKKMKLSDCSGFTVCDNVDINVSATDTEKRMIKQLLETGVYI